ncbi:hypothetical protein F4604DRAFT_1958937 [Suillus subluteus]|nr:hypothetical protein F4604DRAFT_1958937 [Suillus subluteus]
MQYSSNSSVQHAFFASCSIVVLDASINTNVPGGWVDHYRKQLYVQVAYICVTCSYTFIVTALIAQCINTILGLHMRTTAEGEELGLDEVEYGITSRTGQHLATI